ncbi:MAG: methyltransferase [Dehalococcoidia bacterium]
MPALAPVQRQYEDLPYPHRDPAAEMDLLRQPTLCELPRIQSLAWSRPRDLATLRVLDAGCGTGDNTVFLAEQLRGTGAEIVALDFSEASLEINRARLTARGLGGVEHVHAWIEDAPSLGLGEFDVVVCTGVLHHLESPTEGLRALRSMLRPDGLLAVMVYATYGREPVYLMQSLLRRLAPSTLSPDQRLRILKQTLQGLPPQSRTLRGLMDSPFFRAEIANSDAGAYDLLLHTQDRPYTVPEVHEWMAEAGMRVLDWAIPRQYDPSTYLAGVNVGAMSMEERAATAELMHGGMTKHEFFAERTDAPERVQVAVDDPRAVPVWCGYDFPAAVRSALAQPKIGPEFRCTFGLERDVSVPADPLGKHFLGVVDGQTPVAAILESAGAIAPALSESRIRRRWVEFAGAFHAVAALGLYAETSETRPTHSTPRG